VEYKVVNANILEWAKEYKGQKFHAILCDPPYGLEFMGKKWDSFSDSTNSALGGQSPRNKIPGTPFKRRGKPISGWCEKDRLMAKKNYYEFSLNWALAIYEHLLPGAYLLVFGGTRTFHRLACALEDAGFDIRDTVFCWSYGCLSEDTEILIDGRWEPYYKAVDGHLALCYNKDDGTYSWQPIEDHFEYDYSDTAYRIVSDNTDQIVSRNHRCLVERNGKFVFGHAETLECEEVVPVLENLPELLCNFSLPQEGAGEEEQVLFERMYSKKSDWKMSIENGNCASCEPQSTGQSVGQSGIVFKQSRSQTVRGERYTKADLARVQPTTYVGKMWCVKVPTGAFVARRNGKIFVTGNSGFPKSLNVSKQLEGICRQDAWDGYGTALKPSVEPIIVARKPIKGPVAENCLKYGSGALNIDGGRIKGTVTSNPIVRNAKGFESVGLIQGETGKGVVSHGRWPANLILQHSPECVLSGTKKHKTLGYTKPDGTETVEDWDCVEGCPVRKLDEQSGELKSGQLLSHHKRTGDSIIGTFKIRDRSDEEKNFGGDSGGASRFFYNVDWSNEIEERLGIADPVRYCAKASRAERDAGCGNLEIGTGGGMVGTADNLMHNTHPTVKPINLIRYLATLLLPPKECAPRRILVPFAGSGSELIGAMQAGWDEIVGVEREKEYCELAETRLAYWKNRRPTDPNSKKKTKQEKVDKEQLTLL